MTILRTIPEADMVLEFLRAEMASPRFSQRYETWLIQHVGTPEVKVESLGAEVRKELLHAVRPGLFKTLPHDIVWKEICLDTADWDNVLYINEADWKSFSDGTRKVLRGIDKLGQSHHEKLTQRVAEMTHQLQAGQSLPKIILVAAPDCTKLVLLEGHARATAYVASGMYQEKKIPAILGLSETIGSWTWY